MVIAFHADLQPHTDELAVAFKDNAGSLERAANGNEIRGSCLANRHLKMLYR